jgi:hypothetical protein
MQKVVSYYSQEIHQGAGDIRTSRILVRDITEAIQGHSTYTFASFLIDQKSVQLPSFMQMAVITCS